MPQARPEPGLDSVRAGQAPFSAELVALNDFLTLARVFEEGVGGPTEEAHLRMAEALASPAYEDTRRRVLSAMCRAALLEASRG